MASSAHFAKASPNVKYVDLDSAYLLNLKDISEYIDGTKYGKNLEVKVQNKPGLGVEVDKEFLENLESIKIE